MTINSGIILRIVIALLASVLLSLLFFGKVKGFFFICPTQNKLEV